MLPTFSFLYLLPYTFCTPATTVVDMSTVVDMVNKMELRPTKPSPRQEEGQSQPTDGGNGSSSASKPARRRGRVQHGWAGK